MHSSKYVKFLPKNENREFLNIATITIHGHMATITLTLQAGINEFSLLTK